MIEKYLKQERNDDIPPKEYARMLIYYLDYPENFWKEIFSELSREARMIIMMIDFFRGHKAYLRQLYKTSRRGGGGKSFRLGRIRAGKVVYHHILG